MVAEKLKSSLPCSFGAAFLLPLPLCGPVGKQPFLKCPVLIEREAKRGFDHVVLAAFDEAAVLLEHLKGVRLHPDVDLLFLWWHELFLDQRHVVSFAGQSRLPVSLFLLSAPSWSSHQIC